MNSSIAYELQHAIGKHSRKLVVTNIELFLDYCMRFYDRQFITRNNVHKGIIEQFDRLLVDYICRCGTYTPIRAAVKTAAKK